MKIREIHIGNYKIFKDFKIDFTFKEDPLNLVVLAGINGSGKSSLLEFIYDLIAIHKIPFDENNKVIGETFDPISNKLVKTVYSGSPFDNYSSFVNNSPNISKSNDSVLFFRPFEINLEYSNDLIIKYIDKLIYEKDKKSSEVYELVRKKLQSIFEGFNLQVEFNLLDKDRNIFFKNERSERIPISQLSGGEKELITRAFTLYVSDIKDTIILIDEPETSLHPNWQNRILKIYEDFAVENNNQIIIATHSPHIIASAKKESLRLLVKKNEKIEVISDFDGSYGYEVQRVLLDIMNLESLRIPGVNEKIEKLYKLVHNDHYKTEEFLRLQSELEQLLGKNDKDLMLIRLEIAKRNKLNEKNS